VILSYDILNLYFSSNGLTVLPKHPQKTNTPAIMSQMWHTNNCSNRKLSMKSANGYSMPERKEKENIQRNSIVKVIGFRVLHHMLHGGQFHQLNWSILFKMVSVRPKWHSKKNALWTGHIHNSTDSWQQKGISGFWIM